MEYKQLFQALQNDIIEVETRFEVVRGKIRTVEPYNAYGESDARFLLDETVSNGRGRLFDIKYEDVRSVKVIL